MTALADEYVACYSAQRVLDLTQVDVPEAITNSTSRLEKAVLAAILDFERNVGISFDATDQDHLTIGVEGVDAWLVRRAPPARRSETPLNLWRGELRVEAERRSQHAFSPKTDSAYTPSNEPIGRPPLDNISFDRLRMDPPRSSNLNRTDRGW